MSVDRHKTHGPPQPRTTDHGQRTNTGPRTAYTLLEMLLVLAVLVAVAGISWPGVQRAYGNYRLRQAAEAVRDQATAARLQAVDRGCIYQFRYEPDGDRYLMVPYEWDEESDVNPLRRDAGRLPQGMSFEPLGSQSAAGERIVPEALDGLPDAHQLAGDSWSPPLLFHPDGSGQDAAFLVRDAKEQSVRLTVRGLTGAVTVGPVQREERR